MMLSFPIAELLPIFIQKADMRLTLRQQMHRQMRLYPGQIWNAAVLIGLWMKLWKKD